MGKGIIDDLVDSFFGNTKTPEQERMDNANRDGAREAAHSSSLDREVHGLFDVMTCIVPGTREHEAYEAGYHNTERQTPYRTPDDNSQSYDYSRPDEPSTAISPAARTPQQPQREKLHLLVTTISDRTSSSSSSVLTGAPPKNAQGEYQFDDDPAANTYINKLFNEEKAAWKKVGASEIFAIYQALTTLMKD